MKYGLFLNGKRYNATAEFRRKEDADRAAISLSVALNEWIEVKGLTK